MHTYILLERERVRERENMRNKNKNKHTLVTTSSMIEEENSVTLITPSRKSRTKTRRPKFLSLRLQISPENTSDMAADGDDHRHHQLNLFPLHPENMVEDKDSHDDNVAYFFSAVDGGATSLTSLLGAETSSSACDRQENNPADLSPESLTYAYGGQDSEEVEQLVRTAMRNKARREPSEEKWVSCGSPVSDVRSRNDQKATTTTTTIQRQRLSLKLDYQEIMDAWSNKGPLYIHVADSPQVVPDLHDDDLFGHPSTNGLGGNGGLWSVPEMSGSNSNGNNTILVEEVQKCKMKQREASVLRYKEKRQNRLFSKTIRYEVRKLNAEKRPRIKGRFVKRN